MTRCRLFPVLTRLVPIATLLASVAFGGCSAIRVTTDWDRSVDFAQYRSFRWAPTKKSEGFHRGDGSLLDARIRRAVDAELVSRGLSAATGGGRADLLAVYRVTSRDRVDVYRYDTFRRPYRRGVDVHRYREGTLLLMLVDPVRDQVVWEGAAVGVVAGTDGGEQVTEAVAKILKEFPPQ